MCVPRLGVRIGKTPLDLYEVNVFLGTIELITFSIVISRLY